MDSAEEILNHLYQNDFRPDFPQNPTKSGILSPTSSVQPQENPATSMLSPTSDGASMNSKKRKSVRF
jgi:hypothetical protein